MLFLYCCVIPKLTFRVESRCILCTHDQSSEEHLQLLAELTRLLLQYI